MVSAGQRRLCRSPIPGGDVQPRVAAARDRAYLKTGKAMTRTIPQDISAGGRMTVRPLALGLAIMVGLLVAATAMLWFHYGTAVFYETLLAGLNACF
jgi:hypothetical protein